MKFGRCHNAETERDLLCCFSEDEEEDEEVTEPKADPENNLQLEEEESKDTKEGKRSFLQNLPLRISRRNYRKTKIIHKPN